MAIMPYERPSTLAKAIADLGRTEGNLRPLRDPNKINLSGLPANAVVRINPANSDNPLILSKSVSVG